MRAVKGSVVSSRPISLSKAAAVLTRFASAETGARPEIAAYLRRASTAFDELVQFHHEIKTVRRGTERDAPRKEEEEEDGSGGDGLKEEKKRRKKKKEKGGMENGGLRGDIGALAGRDSMEDERNSGAGVGSELEEMRDAKRKKKRRRREAEEEEKSNIEREEEEVEEERRGKRWKKKEDKGEREEEGVGDGLDGEGRDGDTKERRGLDYEIEWHEKNKRKKRIREIGKED